MHKKLLTSTVSSIAFVAALMTAPSLSFAVNYCFTDQADCTASNSGTKVAANGTQALGAGSTGVFETNPEAGTFTIANGVTSGAVTTSVASTTSGTGTLTITAGAGTTGAGNAGSATNYLGTVNVNGGAIGNTAAFSGVLDANAVNVNTATATVAGVAHINTLTLTTGNTTFSGAANTIGTLTSNTASGLTLSGTTTVSTFNASGATTVGANSTITTLGSGTGSILVLANKTLTLTNGASSSTGGRAWTFGTSANSGAGGTVGNITTASTHSIDLSGGTVTFSGTNTAGASDRTKYTLASATGTGTVKAAGTFTAASQAAGYTYLDKLDSAGQAYYVAQIKNANYTASTATGNGAGAANRSNVATFLLNNLAGGMSDVASSNVDTYLDALGSAVTGTDYATQGSLYDQAAPQMDTQLINSTASQFMQVVSDRTQGGKMASGEAMGIAAGDVHRGRAVWAKAFGGIGRSDTHGGVAGFDVKSGGAAVGFETAVGANSNAGVSFSYAAGQFESNEAGAPKKTDSNSYQASIYGNTYVKPNWFFDVQAGGGYHTFDSTNTYVGLINARGDYHAWGYFGSIGTGYDIAGSRPGSKVTPYATLSYSGLAFNDYTENGAGGLSRKISRDNSSTLTGRLGAKAQWDVNYGSTVFTPQLRVAYQYDFTQDGVSATSAFVGNGSTATFKTTGQKLDKSAYIGGLGVSFARADGWTIDANYDYEGRQDFNSHSASLLARYNF